jgi:hypothetical protein
MCYRKARRLRVDRHESAAEIDALLALSESIPVVMTVSQSLYGSSMNTHSSDWQRALTIDTCGEYETTTSRKR